MSAEDTKTEKRRKEMYFCNNDFTYDMFMEDAKLYKALPYNGVYASTDNYRKYFMRNFKKYAETFKAKWFATYGKCFDEYHHYIGDAFAEEELTDWFSDFYKDAYGQRPHLPAWFYLQALDGFPSDEDIYRKFCATPVQDAINNAKVVREKLLTLN